MIKSLLGDDELVEKPKNDAGNAVTSTEIKPTVSSGDKSADEKKAALRKEDLQAVKPFEVVAAIGKPKAVELEPKPLESDGSFPELVSPTEGTSAPKSTVNDNKQIEDAVLDVQENSAMDGISADSDRINILPKAFTPEPPAETIRNSGLAYSAAIVLFASVVFMMLLGWFADLNFGTAPWGIVGGIVLGSIIGFVQFFRTTAQILRPPKSDVEKHNLFSDKTDKE